MAITLRRSEFFNLTTHRLIFQSAKHRTAMTHAKSTKTMEIPPLRGATDTTLTGSCLQCTGLHSSVALQSDVWMSATFMIFFSSCDFCILSPRIETKEGSTQTRNDCYFNDKSKENIHHSIPFHSVHLPATHCSSTFSHSVDNRDPPFGPCDPEKSRGDFDFVEKHFVYAVCAVYAVYGWVYDWRNRIWTEHANTEFAILGVLDAELPSVWTGIHPTLIMQKRGTQMQSCDLRLTKLLVTGTPVPESLPILAMFGSLTVLV